MAKGTKEIGEPTSGTPSEVGELHEMMQNMIAEIGALTGKISYLKKLDQPTVEWKNQLAASGETRRNKTPLEHE